MNEAFSVFDSEHAGTVPLAKAVGILASLPACRAWPDTYPIHRIIAPYLVKASDSKNDALVDYKAFLAAHGDQSLPLIRLEEVRNSSGIYDRLACEVSYML